MKKLGAWVAIFLCLVLVLSSTAQAASQMPVGEKEGVLSLPADFSYRGIYDCFQSKASGGVQVARYGTSFDCAPFVNFGDELDSVNRRVYDVLMQIQPSSAYEVKVYFSFGHDLTQTEFNQINIQAIAEAFYMDCPECFWFTTFTIHYRPYYSQGKKYFREFYIEYSPDTDDYADPIGLNDQLWNLLDELNFDDSRTRAYLLIQIHDYLVQNIVYTDTDKSPCYDPIGALIDHKAVCQGYAEAFKLICDLYAIPCICVVGVGRGAPGEQGGNHEWNAVQMDDGKWYFVDATWDDQTTGTVYDYFLCGTQSQDSNGYTFSSLHDVATSNGFAGSLDFIYPAFSAQTFLPEQFTLTDVSIVRYPQKRSYYVGDSTDSTGLILSAEYNGGTKATVTSGFFCYPFTMEKVGTQTILVDYNGTYVSYDVQVGLRPPKLSSASNATSGVTVKWSKVPGASGYYVFRKAGSAKGWSKLTTVTGTSFTDKKVKSGTTYTYTVRAYSGKTLSGYNSKGVSVKFLSAPKISSAKSGSKGITVKYGKVTGAYGYVIYRRTSSGGWQKIATTKSLSLLDKTAKKKVTYYYTVRAYSGKTYSAYYGGARCKR